MIPTLTPRAVHDPAIFVPRGLITSQDTNRLANNDTTNNVDSTEKLLVFDRELTLYLSMKSVYG